MYGAKEAQVGEFLHDHRKRLFRPNKDFFRTISKLFHN